MLVTSGLAKAKNSPMVSTYKTVTAVLSTKAHGQRRASSWSFRGRQSPGEHFFLLGPAWHLFRDTTTNGKLTKTGCPPGLPGEQGAASDSQTKDSTQVKPKQTTFRQLVSTRVKAPTFLLETSPNSRWVFPAKVHSATEQQLGSQRCSLWQSFLLLNQGWSRLQRNHDAQTRFKPLQACTCLKEKLLSKCRFKWKKKKTGKKFSLLPLSPPPPQF